MKTIEVKISADAMSATVECNGIKQMWERTGNGCAKAKNKVDWYDHFDEDVVDDIIEKIFPLDLMYACGGYKSANKPK